MSSLTGLRATENETFVIFAEQEMKFGVSQTYKRDSAVA